LPDARDAVGELGAISRIGRYRAADLRWVDVNFDSKDDLAAALYVEGLRDYQEGSVAQFRAHTGAEDGVKAAVVHHLRWVMGHARGSQIRSCR
jgi:hypothetical protein